MLAQSAVVFFRVKVLARLVGLYGGCFFISSVLAVLDRWPIMSLIMHYGAILGLVFGVILAS